MYYTHTHTHTHTIFSGQVFLKYPLEKTYSMENNINYWITSSKQRKPCKTLNFLVQTYFWSHALNFGCNGINAVLYTKSETQPR